MPDFVVSPVPTDDRALSVCNDNNNMQSHDQVRVPNTYMTFMGLIDLWNNNPLWPSHAVWSHTFMVAW